MQAVRPISAQLKSQGKKVNSNPNNPLALLAKQLAQVDPNLNPNKLL